MASCAAIRQFQLPNYEKSNPTLSLTYWQAVEHVYEALPQLDVVATLAFVVETINPINCYLV